MTATPASTTASVSASVSSTGRRALILIGAVALAVAANLVIAAIATAAGSPEGYGPLSAPALLAFTVVPMALGWFAWQWVLRRSRTPRRTLTVLVVAVLGVSFIPDVVLAVTGFIPGTTAAGVVGLMAAHVVVMGSAVAGYTLASRR